MEEKQYSEKVERINRRKRLLLKISLIIISVVLIFFTFYMMHLDHLEEAKGAYYRGTKTYDVYINGVYQGRETHTSIYYGPFHWLTIAGGVLLFISVVMIIIAFKGGFDFRKSIEAKEIARENGAFSNASKKRKVLFWISLLSGYAGIDRFAAGCIFRGLFKLALFFVAIGCTYDFYHFYPDVFIEDIILTSVSLSLVLLFWIKDTVNLRKGVYKGRKRKYIS